MTELLNLGELYVSDFVKETNGAVKHELKIIMDEKIGAPRLEKIVPKEEMYGKYWYHSGTNDTMKRQLKDVVDSILPLVYHEPNDGLLRIDKWLDIASNDGTLLSFVPNTFSKLGIDPCEGEIYESAKQHADIIQDYFRSDIFKMTGERFKVVTTIAMFYDLDDPIGFSKQVYDIMDDEGLWVIQMSYTPLMLKQLAFDNIVHEHIFYHSYMSMQNILDEAGFKIMDCTLNDTNGGSFRLFIRKKVSQDKNFMSQPQRDVANMRCDNIYHFELSEHQKTSWQKFAHEILLLKKQVYDFIKGETERGKIVMGYGASTKGNTLLQYFGLDSTLIKAIAERNENKVGLKTIGSNIPIVSEDEMRTFAPDYLLVLPWHFINEIREREKKYLHGRTKLIVPMPKFEIIDL